MKKEVCGACVVIIASFALFEVDASIPELLGSGHQQQTVAQLPDQQQYLAWREQRQLRREQLKQKEEQLKQTEELLKQMEELQEQDEKEEDELNQKEKQLKQKEEQLRQRNDRRQRSSGTERRQWRRREVMRERWWLDEGKRTQARASTIPHELKLERERWNIDNREAFPFNKSIVETVVHLEEIERFAKSIGVVTNPSDDHESWQKILLALPGYEEGYAGWPRRVLAAASRNAGGDGIKGVVPIEGVGWIASIPKKMDFLRSHDSRFLEFAAITDDAKTRAGTILSELIRERENWNIDRRDIFPFNESIVQLVVRLEEMEEFARSTGIITAPSDDHENWQKILFALPGYEGGEERWGKEY